MRRPSRIRRWFKWIGTTVCVLLLVMWVYSVWGSVFRVCRVRNAECTVELTAQNLWFIWVDSGVPRQTEWIFRWRHPLALRLWLPHASGGGMSRNGKNIGFRTFNVPLWIPILLIAIPTLFLFWRDHQLNPTGHCQKCGYNLTGNVSGICPECGEKI
jgi:hypothetical protein